MVSCAGKPALCELLKLLKTQLLHTCLVVIAGVAFKTNQGLYSSDGLFSKGRQNIPNTSEVFKREKVLKLFYNAFYLCDWGVGWGVGWS